MNKSWKKWIAVVISGILVLSAVIVLLQKKPVVVVHIPRYELPSEYMVLVEEPKTEWEMMFVAALTPIILHNGYHPFFILENGSLDSHQLWTINNLTIADIPKLLFTNSSETEEKVAQQVTNVERFNMTPDILYDFKGFNGTISVASYEECLWVSTLAVKKNLLIKIGKSHYENQSEVWEELYGMGISADYVVIANPKDYMTEIYDQWHVKSLSVLSASLAAYHDAYIITRGIPTNESLVDFRGDSELEKKNANATAYYNALLHIYEKYGPIEYIALVGSAAAVPQFELPDHSESEGDGLVSSDSVYAFLDDDEYTADACVGRIINYNVQGASNMLVRTFMYDYFVDEVTVEYTSGPKTRNWKKHGSSFNGYQITHQRMQATPGYYFCEDLEDEGFTFEYYGPSGIGTAPRSSQTVKEDDFDPILQCSGIMAYRGHGSWHGSFYSLRVFFQFNNPGKVEGTHARELFLPPQIALFAACENGKIYGKSYRGEDIEFDKIFSISYLYAGAIGLVGATEVSYSNIGQDVPATVGRVTGDHKWDMNNAVYAFFWDGILNHEDEYGTTGKAFRWMLNRFIKYHDFTITPLKQEGEGPVWKTVAMYALYGDPAFGPIPTKPGPNQKDEWHNGPDDY